MPGYSSFRFFFFFLFMREYLEEGNAYKITIIILIIIFETLLEYWAQIRFLHPLPSLSTSSST